MAREIISFDWALKYTLRDKANFEVLEGFFTTILGHPVKIEDILESESNKQSPDDRMIRLDLKARLGDGELALIEFQYKPEHHFFRRLLFYTSKTLIEHAHSGSGYEKLPKIYTICICDFKLGDSADNDYVYQGRQKFIGLHNQRELKLSPDDAKRLSLKGTDEIFPEYIIISLGNFSGRVHDQIDEWLYTLKTCEVGEDFSAPGLIQAAERLDILKLSKKEKKRYDDFALEQRIVRNQVIGDIEMLNSAKAEGIAQGKAAGKIEGRQELYRELILKSHKQGWPPEQISQFFNLRVRVGQVDSRKLGKL